MLKIFTNKMYAQTKDKNSMELVIKKISDSTM